MGNDKQLHNDIPVVTIKCLTFNHAPYLRQTLDGFVMQKTNFKFVAYVHDDASTDGTTAIVREYAERYPDIIKPIIQTENQYWKGGGEIDRTMLEVLNGKYVAICEGDDYWTDPLKLQKQVDYLESHPDCSMCYTDVKVYLQDQEQLIDWNYASAPETLTTKKLMKRNRVMTATVLIRGEIYRSFYRDFALSIKTAPLRDYPQWLWASQFGYIHHSHEITGVYRILKSSAIHHTNKWGGYYFRVAIFDCRILISKYFGLHYGWWERVKRDLYVIRACARNGWWKAMRHDLFHRRRLQKKGV